MGVTSSNKLVNADRISCDGSLKVTLALTAAPDIVENPTDIVLILDRSGSMAGAPLAAVKEGAKAFIDIIDEATDGTQDGQIGNGSRIGIVSFATDGRVDAQLITSVDTLKNAVDSLVSGGSTNHAQAFAKATELFSPPSGNAKVMVMFTDGNTTVGAPPAPVAEAAKAQGIVIYCIGLIGSDGLDIDALNTWATDPDASHVAVTPDAADLEELFAELAANISKPGATNVLIKEKLTSDFELVDIDPPEIGMAIITGLRSLRWSIDSLGVTKSESAALHFTVRHVGSQTGEVSVNEEIEYSDDEQNEVKFPDPKVYVDCGEVVHPEPEPEPVQFSSGPCEEQVCYDMGELSLNAQGRLVELGLTLRSVCPSRRVALGVLLEDGEEGGFRSFKAFVIPAQCGKKCRDIRVEGIRFVVPDTRCHCLSRDFTARAIANYMDTDAEL